MLKQPSVISETELAIFDLSRAINELFDLRRELSLEELKQIAQEIVKLNFIFLEKQTQLRPIYRVIFEF